jgi:flagellar motor switch protein FliM
VVIEPIMPRLSVHHWFVSQKKSRVPEEVDALQSRLTKAKLPIIAELGTSEITIRDFLSLAVGDVIPLPKSTDDPLQIKVGEKLKYLGSPGTMKNKLAIQITDIVNEGGEEEHDE